jgi:hypothetical protein
VWAGLPARSTARRRKLGYELYRRMNVYAAYWISTRQPPSVDQGLWTVPAGMAK